MRSSRPPRRIHLHLPHLVPCQTVRLALAVDRRLLRFTTQLQRPHLPKINHALVHPSSIHPVVHHLLIPREGQDLPRVVVPRKGSPLQEDFHLDKDPLQDSCPLLGPYHLLGPCRLQGPCPLVLLKAVIKDSLLDVSPNLSSTACRVPPVALHPLCSPAVHRPHNNHTHNKYPLLNNSSQCQDVSDTRIYLDSSS